MGDLGDALADEVSGFPPARLGEVVRGLIERYRTGVDPRSVVLDSEVAAVAYAAYRMPATHAALGAVFDVVSGLAPGFEPASMVDVGGGTGAAVWAALAAWGSLREVTVIDQSAQALALGKRLAGRGGLRGVQWRRAGIGEVPPADVVTMSYVLNELTERARADAVAALARAGGLVVVVEPGTPAGYERVLAARDVLVAAGLRVVAPCPHSGACPIPTGQDWCHFTARLNRSAVHRKIKDATLGFEDEKFSYVAAARADWAPAPGRVVRHPVKRKGLVSLRVCGADGALADVTVTKRTPESYRDARDVAWGDAWTGNGSP
ncbi:small ribosomal subunit Rsm22 family protein [Actinokineospora auranticolor]|uniref:Ribosomal protein RSM22 (Predicted rRNA methylase) n=1 Tax=Actinokineospora auranticolor TaxID=155976 RepID=A0A2S6H091_9PSEU|nr:small ribosomal subunit Rsm22 family protein [Actinokineospora auranticolor]PPK70899.1 ribosomal protein RSM22 (predicted rRNA methylase) [Actinokineospora auranticolor]